MKKVIPSKAILIPSHADLMFKGIIYDTYQWKQQLFDGSDATFEMLRRPDTVTAVCIVEDNILVLRDEQPHRGVRRGLPGGRVDETDKDIVAAVSREALEETGYEFENWKLLKVWQPQRKIEWFVYLYVAWGVKQASEPHLDAGEKIIVEHLPLEAVKELAADKEGALGELQEILSNISSTNDLTTLPEFKGEAVEL